MKRMITKKAIGLLSMAMVWAIICSDSFDARRLIDTGNGAYPTFNNETGKVELRGLFFGTSRTWGTGLEHRRSLVYPWLVTDEVTNLAIRGTGPKFPAMCTRSLVGDDLRVDFVVYEYYYIINRPSERGKLYTLAQRIRTRFPDATMIFIITPTVLMFENIRTQDMMDKVMTERNIPVRYGVFEPMPERRLELALLGTNATEDWVLRQVVGPLQEISKALVDFGAHAWTPIPIESNTTDQLKDLASMYFMDTIHYNPSGHRRIAAAIQSILMEAQTKRSDRVHKWGSYDNCVSWYDNGNTTLLEHSPNMNMYRWNAKNVQDMNGGKHALEVTSTSWVRIRNHQPNVYLYIFYMVAAPEQKYPKTKVIVSHSNDVKDWKNIIYQLDVVPTVDGSNDPLHLIRGTMITKVPAGDLYLIFQPQESNRERPFRLTGVALSETADKDDWQGWAA